MIRYPAGRGKTNFTVRADIAEAAANIRVNALAHENRVYDTCAPVACTFNDVCERIDEVTGRRIDYIDIPTEEFRVTLQREGLPPIEVGLMGGIAESIKSSEGMSERSELEGLLGRPATGLKDFSRTPTRPSVLRLRSSDARASPVP